jgi:hypothetical protein
LLRSIVFTSQTTAPVAASSATRRPSSVPTYTLPFQTATPRFTTSQQALRAQARGTCGSWRQSRAPVRASSATTTLQGSETNIVPSTTIGVASWPRPTPVSNDQASPSCATLA